MSNENTDGNVPAVTKNTGISEASLLTYSKAYLAQPKAKAYYDKQGFNQTMSADFCAYVLVQEAQIEEGNKRDVREILLSFGLGSNASQLRQKLVKLGAITATTASTLD